MTDVGIGQIVLIITTAGGFAAQAWREARNRKWAIADRRAELAAQTAQITADAQARAAALIIETEAKAKALHLGLMTRAEEIRTRLAIHDQWERDERRAATDTTAHVVSLIEEAKTAAQSAFSEANNVNLKIADLNKRLLYEEKKDS